MQALQSSSSSPTRRLTPSSINLNLETIGRVEAHKLRRLGPVSPCLRDEFMVLSAAHAGLPRPGSSLDGRFFTVAESPSLVVIAATRHACAYYVIANPADRATLAAMRGMVKRGPLRFVLTHEGEAPAWSALYFEDEVTKLGHA